MNYIKVNDTLYPATIRGRLPDVDWGRRNSKSITLEMDYATATELFVDGLVWSIITTEIVDGVEQAHEYDNSDYCVAGPITDNRDGTLTVKMGMYTDVELLLMEVLG